MPLAKDFVIQMYPVNWRLSLKCHNLESKGQYRPLCAAALAVYQRLAAVATSAPDVNQQLAASVAFALTICQ